MLTIKDKMKPENSWWLNLLAVTAVTVAAATFINADGLSADLEQIQLSELSDADIDMILAVKNEMHEAAIRAN